MQIEWTQCEIRKCKTSIHTTTTTAAQWPGTFVWHENNNKKEAQKKKSSKRKEQTITMCVRVCVCVFCQTAILRSICHNTLKFSLNSSASALAHWVPSGRREREREHKNYACLPAWHARSLYLVMLPHVLALPSIHSLSLSCSLSWPAAQAATKAAAAAATSFQLRWHSTHSSLVRWRLCRQAALSSSLRVFPCALLN